jgi:phosphoglycolate phosphatase
MPTLQIHDRLYPHLRALIFDKDGTLAQSHDYLHQQAYLRWDALVDALGDLATIDLHDRLFQAWGLRSDQVHPAGLLAVGSRHDNELVTAGYLTPLGLNWIEAWRLVNTAFKNTKLQQDGKAKLTPPLPDLAQHLDRFKAAGFKLAILSADTEDNLQSFVDTWDLTAYFETWVGAQPGLAKPNPKLLEITCDRLQVDPQEVLVIGDSDADIELAKGGGAAGAIGFSYGWSVPVTLPQADHMITDLKDLKLHTN